MHPLFGFVIFALCAIIVGVVAGKRLGALYGVGYVIGINVAGFFLVIIASRATGGDGLVAGFAAFISPFIALIIALSSSTSERKAVLTGEHGEYKKCPYCAEPIRKEAIKCKHCGSDLKPATYEQQAANFKPTDMAFDEFFIREGHEFVLNKSSVDLLISRMKKANPNTHLTNVKEKYQSNIDELVNQLPSKIQQDFRKYYSSQI